MKNIKISVIVAALLLWAGVACAVSVQLGQGPIAAERTGNIIEVKSLGMNHSAGVQAYYNPTVGKKGNISYDKWNGSAGEYNYDLANNRKNVTWSVDLYQPMGNGSNHTYENVIVTDQNYLATVDKLFYQYEMYTAANVGNNPALGIAAAAFQLALWEVTYETGEYDLTSGWFYAKADDETTLGDMWLTSLDGIIAPDYDKAFYVNDKMSDIIAFTENIPGGGGVTPSVPEPLTLLCAGLSCGAVGVYLRKRINDK
jgi:hypothetical protein